ncbi:MAG: CopG family antitoxin [Spirochaetaceae bacterium]|nr:CopG family antitoxin [Spirochaetaceae bacterium]
MTAERRAELIKELEEEEKELQELEDNGHFDEAFKRFNKRLKAERKAINIKLPNDVVDGYKKVAAQNNMPYQTLIGVVLKRYLDGRITLNEPLL